MRPNRVRIGDRLCHSFLCCINAMQLDVLYYWRPLKKNRSARRRRRSKSPGPPPPKEWRRRRALCEAFDTVTHTNLLQKFAQLDFPHYTLCSEKKTPTHVFCYISIEYVCLDLHKIFIVCLWVVFCSRNRVPGPGSKIHYPVPNPGNWHPVFVLITDKKCNFGLPLYLLLTYVMIFNFPLYLLRSLLFLLTYVFTFDNSITKLCIERIIGMWKIFGKVLGVYVRIIALSLHYLLKSWNRVRVPG